jgi:hypothetical protein
LEETAELEEASQVNQFMMTLKAAAYKVWLQKGHKDVVGRETMPSALSGC